ncbi:MAG: hypothetical protein WC003_15235, partial [Terrimicrobiaceae bacterium]
WAHTPPAAGRLRGSLPQAARQGMTCWEAGMAKVRPPIVGVTGRYWVGRFNRRGGDQFGLET